MAQADRTGVDNIPLAVGAIVFAVFALSLGDAFVKSLGESFVLWQIFTIRSALVIPFLVGFAVLRSRDALSMPVSVTWTVLRSLLLVVMWITYYQALPHISLSAAAAGFYTAPIFITLYAWIFSGEPISKASWFAVFVGFAGVCLILRPRAGDFNMYALLPLLSAMLYASAMFLTRTKCRAEHPIVLALALNMSFVVAGSAATAILGMGILPDEGRTGFLLAPWAPMGPKEWLSMGVLAVSILIGSVGAAVAYQNGPAPLVSTFDFAYIGFAVCWGVLMFADVPDLVSVAGMILIVAAGILALRR